MTLTIAQTRLAAEAKWWINHEALMDYAQTRPVPLAAIKARRKCATDCSGSVYGIWHALGYDDPTGGEYTSQDIVYTGTLLTANQRLPSGAVWRVGDLAIFANSESTTHVAFVIDEAADPLLCSHGSQSGPGAITLTAEHAWHTAHGAPIVHHVRTTLPHDTPPRHHRWHVQRGNGDTLATTRHPHLWTEQHHPFTANRKRVTYTQVDE